MTSAQGILKPERPKGAPLVIVFTSTDLNYNFPSWWKRARVRIQDGGASSPTSTTTATAGAKGGDAGTSWIDIQPDTPYAVIVGAGGVGSGAGTNSASVAGGLSSATPRGGSAITSANAQLRMPGGDGSAILGGVNPGVGGNSMLGTISASASVAGHIYGGGAPGAAQNAASNPGATGCVIFEYLEA